MTVIILLYATISILLMCNEEYYSKFYYILCNTLLLKKNCLFVILTKTSMGIYSAKEYFGNVFYVTFCIQRVMNSKQ